MRKMRLAQIVFAPCLSLFAGCGSLLGISDLPGLDGGAGSDSSGGPSEAASDGKTVAADSGGVTEDASINDANVTNAEAGNRATDTDAGDASTMDTAVDATSAEGGCSVPGSCVTRDSGEDSAAVTPPSCAPGGAGMTNCGALSESCCTSLEVTGGTYYRTYTNRAAVRRERRILRL